MEIENCSGESTISCPDFLANNRLVDDPNDGAVCGKKNGFSDAYAFEFKRPKIPKPLMSTWCEVSSGIPSGDKMNKDGSLDFEASKTEIANRNGLMSIENEEIRSTVVDRTLCNGEHGRDLNSNGLPNLKNSHDDKEISQEIHRSIKRFKACSKVRTKMKNGEHKDVTNLNGFRNGTINLNAEKDIFGCNALRTCDAEKSRLQRVLASLGNRELKSSCVIHDELKGSSENGFDSNGQDIGCTTSSSKVKNGAISNDVTIDTSSDHVTSDASSIHVTSDTSLRYVKSDTSLNHITPCTSSSCSMNDAASPVTSTNHFTRSSSLTESHHNPTDTSSGHVKSDASSHNLTTSTSSNCIAVNGFSNHDKDETLSSCVASCASSNDFMADTSSNHVTSYTSSSHVTSDTSSSNIRSSTSSGFATCDAASKSTTCGTSLDNVGSHSSSNTEIVGNKLAENSTNICETDEPNSSDDSTCYCKWINCNEKLKSPLDLKIHVKEVHVKTMACSDLFFCFWQGCKVYNKPSCSYNWLTKHVNTHVGIRPFQCFLDSCDQSFATRTALTRHVQSHFNERSKYYKKNKDKNESTSNRPKANIPDEAGSGGDLKRKELLSKKLKLSIRSRTPVTPNKGDADFDRVSMDYIKKKLQSLEAKVLHRRRVNGGKFQYNKQIIGRRITETGETEYLTNFCQDGRKKNQTEWIAENCIRKADGLDIRKLSNKNTS